MAKEFICGYCGKKYATIADRTACEQKCACKHKKSDVSEKLTRLHKELDAIKAKKREVESELKAVTKAEADINNEISKLQSSAHIPSDDKPEVKTACFINGKEVDEETMNKVVSLLERLFGE